MASQAALAGATWEQTPGPLITERSREIPLGRARGEPGEIASVVLFLASDLATYLAGAAFDVDGGLGYRAY